MKEEIRVENNTPEMIGIELDKYSRVPIYEQVVEQFKKQILTGVLAADAPLPSVRSLSLTLGVNPNTMQKAFAELDRLNLSYTVAGNGRFVHPKAKELLQRSEAKELYGSLDTLLQKLLTAGQSKNEILQHTQSYLSDCAGRETTENDPYDRETTENAAMTSGRQNQKG